MQQLSESPFMGINAATPFNRFETLRVCEGRDLLSFGFRAVVTPKVIVIEWLEILTYWNNTRASGIERDCSNGLSIDTGFAEHFTGGFGQRTQLVFVRLSCVVWVLALPE